MYCYILFRYTLNEVEMIEDDHATVFADIKPPSDDEVSAEDSDDDGQTTIIIGG